MDSCGDIEPFGTYAPSAAQRWIVELARATPLSRGMFRDAVVRLVLALRKGPIDWRTGDAAFRLGFNGNGTDIGLLLKPQFDGQEIVFLAEAARDSVFVDVGANMGAYTMLVAAAAEWRCRAVAIEPLPALAAQLRGNIALNGFDNVTVVEHAAGEAEGEISLAIDARNLGATSVQDNGDFVVRVRPLVSVLEDAGVDKIGALKIDIEGYEDRVLIPFFRDADRALWPRRIVIEHGERQNWREDCIADMAGRGYRGVARTRSNTMLALSE